MINRPTINLREFVFCNNKTRKNLSSFKRKLVEKNTVIAEFVRHKTVVITEFGES